MVGRRATWVLPALVALAALVCQGALAPVRDGGTASGRAYDGLRAEEVVLAAALGGFRVVVVDVLWVKLVGRWESGAHLEIPPLVETIVALDPRLEAAYSLGAWTLAVHVPAALGPHEARWPWVRQGLLLLEAGAARNSRGWRLRYELGHLLYDLVAQEVSLARALVADSAFPAGVDPVELARRAFLDAQRIAGHSAAVDYAVLRASVMRAGLLADDLARQEEVEGLVREGFATLEHLERHHPGARSDVLVGRREELEAIATRLRERLPR